MSIRAFKHDKTEWTYNCFNDCARGLDCPVGDSLASGIPTAGPIMVLQGPKCLLGLNSNHSKALKYEILDIGSQVKG